MHKKSLRHLSNGVVVRTLKALATQGHANTAAVLAHIAEVDERQLFREEAMPSMYEYCVRVLHYSEDAAYKRIRAARAVRDFASAYDAVAEGRLHLSGLVLLAPKLTPENVDELLAAVTYRTRSEIEHLLAQRFPQADLPERIVAVPPAPAAPPAQVVANTESQLAPGRVAADSLVPPVSPNAPAVSAQFTPPAAPARVKALAPERYGLQLTMDEETHELLRKAQSLLGHQRGAGELASVLKCVLQLLVRDLERRKCAATDKPRPARRPKTPDVIPASVRREVWKRDQGQCTFVNEEGRRCPSRGGLELDHIQPKARATLNGRTTAISAADVRLLCRAHNQLEAERTYGAAFMRHKREQAAAARESRAAGPPGAWPSAAVTVVPRCR